MSRDDIEAVYPLSPMQKGILFHTLYTDESQAYFQQFICTFRGDLNIEAFEHAWQQVLNRHAILRTAFVWEGLDDALQVVGKRARMPWRHHDWRDASERERQSKLADFLSSDTEAGFELTHAPLMRCALIRMTDDEHRFVWSSHHLLMDGWSRTLILNEIGILYDARCRDEQPALPDPRPYGDYIAWLQQQDLREAEDFWRATLKGFTAPTKLGIDHPISEQIGAQRHGELQTNLDEEETRALISAARKNHLTLNTVAQGAWALLLGRCSKQQDIVFGAVISGRSIDLSGIESMIGVFINTLPVRVRLVPDEPLVDWLRQLQEHQARARRYEHVSLAEIKAWSEMPKDLPVFESLMIFQNHIAPVRPASSDRRVKMGDTRMFDAAASYPLVLILNLSRQIWPTALYDCRRFELGVILRVLDQFKMLLNSFARQSDITIAGMLEVLDQADTHRELQEGKDLEEARLETFKTLKRKNLRRAPSRTEG